MENAVIRLARPTSALALVVAAFAAAPPAARAQVFDYALQGKNWGDELGTALCRVGDVDQDGCQDFAVGIPNGHSGDGEVLVFSGRTGSEIARRHGRAGSLFGAAVDGGIDVDKDGFPDVLIGAPYDDTNAYQAGRFVIYSPHLDAILVDVHGTGAYGQLGWSVRAMQDDLDGDGIEDLVVGAPGNHTAFVRSGADGSVIFQETGQAGSYFGFAVCSGGKLDGDNFLDFVVGSPDFQTASGTYVGRIAAFSGKDGSKLWSFDGTTDSYFGQSLAHPGDLDADGRGDILAGAPGTYDTNGARRGMVSVISGATGTEIFEVWGRADGDAYGTDVRTATGDLDGDGTNDFLVGADQSLGSGVGYAQAVSGATGARLITLTAKTHDPTLVPYYGVAVAGGDVNGDGEPDVLVGGFEFDGGRGFVETWITAVAGWSNYGSGFSGSLGVPTLTAKQSPVVGQPLEVDLSDSATAPTTGLLVLGVDSASIPTELGGLLLVAPLLLSPIAVPAAGLKLTTTLPDDPTLLGVRLYLQALELDAGATKGWSFTPGLELRFGFQ
jgi:hypothetical protein